MSATSPRRSGRSGRVAKSADAAPTDAAPTDAAPTDAAARAREICLTLLTARPRSRAELAEVLRRKAIPADVAESVLDRLGEVGLVDDAAVAEAAVHAGLTYRGLGRKALGAELRRRGVSDDIARDAIATVRPEDEEQRARDLVRRKLANTAARDDDAARHGKLARRLAGMLARKGYSEGLALRVVRDELGSGEWATGLDPEVD